MAIPVGTVVQYFDKRAKYQFGDVGEGPYAAVVTAEGKEGTKTLWVLPAHETMLVRMEKNVGQDPDAERCYAVA